MDKTKRLKIVYTSDVHGQLSATNFATNRNEMCGLSRLSSYLHQIEDEVLLLDNGDMLQGSPLLDFARLSMQTEHHPLPKVMNALGYDYYTIGNHDFNYGLNYLLQVTRQINAKLLCANITTKDHKPFFEPYAIYQTTSQLRVGIIGVVTQYIPHWEKKEHIETLLFRDAYETVNDLLPEVQKQADVIVVLYHGGYERNMQTELPHGRLTDENQGYRLSKIPGVHVLLTGHQHVPQVHTTTSGLTLQTGFNASDFGEVIIEYDTTPSGIHISSIQGKIVSNTLPENQDVLSILEPYEQRVNHWLDQEIGSTNIDFKIRNALSARSKKHPLFQLINHIQLDYSKADISCASLPNHPPGFSEVITRREIMANFVYPNTLFKIQITGHQLRAALERNAQYFDIVNQQLVVHHSYLHPKLEHYNYDVYDGIEYEMDIRQPFGSRIVSLKRNGRAILNDDQFTLVLNNYRASGGGDFDMFQNATIVEEYDEALVSIITNYIQQHHTVSLKMVDNYKVLY